VAPAAGAGERKDEKPYTTDHEDRKTAGVHEAQAEARKSNEDKAANHGGVKTDIDEPVPDSPNVTRDSGEAQ
jgi:hypothetical protein